MNNIKKATAAIAAAALCAVSALSTTLNANAAADASYKYTYRSVLLIKNSDAQISKITWNYAVLRRYYGNYAKLGNLGGTNVGGGSAGDQYESCGGTYTPSKAKPGCGIAFTVSTFSKTNDFLTNPKAFSCGASCTGSYIPKFSTEFTRPFLVGDLNYDGQVNDSDYWEMRTAVEAGMIYRSGSSLKADVTNIYWHGRSYGLYMFDMNNDGYVNSADLTLLEKHKNGGSLAGKRFDS